MTTYDNRNPMSRLAQAFGLSAPEDTYMSEEERRRVEYARRQAMANGLLEAGGWKSMPVTFGEAWAHASGQGQQAAHMSQQQWRADSEARAKREQALGAEQARKEMIERYRKGDLSEVDVLEFASRNPSLVNLGTQMLKGIQSRQAGEPEAPPTIEVGGQPYYHDGKTWKPAPRNEMQEWTASFQQQFKRPPTEAELQRKFGVAPPAGRAGAGEATAERAQVWESQIVPMLAQEPGMTPELLSRAKAGYIANGKLDLTVPKGAVTPEQEEARLQSAEAQVASVLEAVGRARELVGFTTTGYVGDKLREYGGTDARNLRATLKTIKANLGFDRLQQMRKESPTGGALGQVAVQELEALQSTVASLDQGQDDDQLRANLDKIERHYRGWLEAMRKSSEGAGSGATKRRRFNPATGRLEDAS